MWVFDSISVVRLTNNKILFYEKPLIRGFTEPAMTLDYGQYAVANFSLFRTFETVEFGRNEMNDTQVFMFGVDSGIVYRYTFDLYLDAKQINLTDVME